MTIDLTPALVQHSQHLLNSFKAFTNQDLIDRMSSLDVQAPHWKTILGRKRDYLDRHRFHRNIPRPSCYILKMDSDR